MSSSRLSVPENNSETKTSFSVPEKPVAVSRLNSFEARENGNLVPQSSRIAPSFPVRENSGPVLSKLSLPTKFNFSKLKTSDAQGENFQELDLTALFPTTFYHFTSLPSIGLPSEAPYSFFYLELGFFFLYYSYQNGATIELGLHDLMSNRTK